MNEINLIIKLFVDFENDLDKRYYLSITQKSRLERIHKTLERLRSQFNYEESNQIVKTSNKTKYSMKVID